MQIASIIVMSAGGARLVPGLIAEMPSGYVRHMHAITLEDAGCAAVLVEHTCEFEELLGVVSNWAARRGWLATLAPLHGAE